MQIHPLDAILQAWSIAASYAQPPMQLSQPRLKLTRADLIWAWQQYRDEDKPASLHCLAALLGVRRATLRDQMIRYWNFEYAKIAARRGPGGDLFARYYGRTWAY